MAARVPGGRTLWRRLPVGSVPLRVQYGIWNRPAYAYGVFEAASLARQLGLPGITAVEFGVAAGAGLVALEEHAAEISAHVGVEIEVVGFDGRVGMPAPTDVRDLPFVWDQGFYQMDETKLRGRLKRARLVLGMVAETVATTAFRLPVGFVSFDLDYYSSTMDALALFDRSEDTRLPRVLCYFDDVIVPERAFMCEHVGELAAIAEFNARHDGKKVGKIAHLNWTRPVQNAWCEQMYALHDFQHPLYRVNITPPDDEHRQLPL
jgi:hypothetical protein